MANYNPEQEVENSEQFLCCELLDNLKKKLIKERQMTNYNIQYLNSQRQKQKFQEEKSNESFEVYI